ncbi:MAG: polysaccharide deacetylase family protein [Chloroflexi bacterium]|nr:polysaccharide deacetylase family protein [Chloroflexota bacterium]
MSSRIKNLNQSIGKTMARRITFRMLPITLSMLLLVYGYFVPSSPVFGKVYSQSNARERVVALTFDDGPNEPYTSEILDILNKYDVKATFFVVGMNVERYPDTARRMLSEGHVLGNHSYSHKANHAISNFGVKDFKRAEEAIYNTTGVIPHLYRPPHGKKTPWELSGLRKAGLIEVNWTVSTNELHRELVFGKPTPEMVAKDIISEITPGKIILLHDGYGTNHNDAKSDKSLTVQALPLIIERLQVKGYRFLTVPELLNVSAYNRVPTYVDEN